LFFLTQQPSYLFIHLNAGSSKPPCQICAHITLVILNQQSPNLVFPLSDVSGGELPFLICAQIYLVILTQ
jgi:hypothetical protein